LCRYFFISKKQRVIENYQAGKIDKSASFVSDCIRVLKTMFSLLRSVAEAQTDKMG
jgi:hypothetical protein